MMEVRTTEKAKGSEYNLSMSTDSAREAGRLLNAAGLVDRVKVQADSGPWAALAAIAGFIMARWGGCP